MPFADVVGGIPAPPQYGRQRHRVRIDTRARSSTPRAFLRIGPVKKQPRAGAHTGWLTIAERNSTPRRASASRFGVRSHRIPTHAAEIIGAKLIGNDENDIRRRTARRGGLARLGSCQQRRGLKKSASCHPDWAPLNPLEAPPLCAAPRPNRSTPPQSPRLRETCQRFPPPPARPPRSRSRYPAALHVRPSARRARFRSFALCRRRAVLRWRRAHREIGGLDRAPLHLAVANLKRPASGPWW